MRERGPERKLEGKGDSREIDGGKREKDKNIER